MTVFSPSRPTVLGPCLVVAVVGGLGVGRCVRSLRCAPSSLCVRLVPAALVGGAGALSGLGRPVPVRHARLLGLAVGGSVHRPLVVSAQPTADDSNRPGSAVRMAAGVPGGECSGEGLTAASDQSTCAIVEDEGSCGHLISRAGSGHLPLPGQEASPFRGAPVVVLVTGLVPVWAAWPQRCVGGGFYGVDGVPECPALETERQTSRSGRGWLPALPASGEKGPADGSSAPPHPPSRCRRPGPGPQCRAMSLLQLSVTVKAGRGFRPCLYGGGVRRGPCAGSSWRPVRRPA